MTRLWISGSVLIVAVATLKTSLVVSFVLTPEQTGVGVISGLFALFTALTAGVAYLSFVQLRRFLDVQRKNRMAPGGGTPVAKEAIISQYASEWGLSQAEADVAIFVAKGFSNAEIADMRGCALATVKSQLSSIFKKSGFETRYQLITFVSDEVCELATDTPTRRKKPTDVKKVLPLVGRAKRAA